MVDLEKLYEEAEKSPCLRLKVGAVGRTRSGLIIYGHNHMQDGSPCEITMELSKPDVIHAEVHVLSQVPQGDSLEYMIVTHSPCIQCAKELHKHNVPYVEYIEDYRLPEGIDFLKSVGIHVIQKEINNEQTTTAFRKSGTQEPDCCIDLSRIC